MCSSSVKKLILTVFYLFTLPNLKAQILNGDFENPVLTVPDHAEITGGELTNWIKSGPGRLVLQKGVAGNIVPPVSGSQHLLFNSGDAQIGAVISQEINTSIGMEYEITLSIGRIGGGAGNMGITVNVTDALPGSIASQRFMAPSTIAYAQASRLRFVARSLKTIIALADTSLTTSSVDVILDAVSISGVDTDGDGVPDFYETGTGVYVSPTNTGTNPAVADTDGDGLNDGVEINQYATNPNLKDSDTDGFEDGFEVSTGFDPSLSSSTPETLSSIQTAVEFRFNAALGQTYRIESSTNLLNWSSVESAIPGTGGTISRFYSIIGTTSRFYRAVRD